MLVDDHEVVRHGISQFIAKQKDLLICGQAGEPEAALSQIPQAHPDVVTVDLTLGEDNGLELVRAIHARYPTLPILVLSMHDEMLYAELALHSGASGYVMKQQSLEIILDAIRTVLGGSVYLSPTMTMRLLRQKSQGGGDPSIRPIERLSDRELEVFQLIGQWKGTGKIADELSLSVKTVEYYREQIKRKLNLRDATELVRMACHWVSTKQAA